MAARQRQPVPYRHRGLLDIVRGEAFIVWPSYREEALEPKLRAREKVYVTDPIYTQLAPGTRPDLTTRSEQQLGMALLRGLEHGVPGSYMDVARVLHHRTSTRTELNLDDPQVMAVPTALLAWLVDT